MTTHRLTLYGTEGCHLCDEAEWLLHQTQGSTVALEKVDIAEQALLLERYGIRIPVLRDTVSGHELNWPFDASGILEFLSVCRPDPSP